MSDSLIVTSVSSSNTYGVGGVGGYAGRVNVYSTDIVATLRNPGGSGYETAGMFGYFDSYPNPSTIASSSVLVNIYANNTIGGLVGDVWGLNVYNTKVEGSISVPSSGYNRIGGLIAVQDDYSGSYQALTISNSYASTTILASSSVSYIGGLVGQNVVG